MNYTVDNYSVLLTEEYGGIECFGEEFELLKKLLKVNEPSELIFTTSEDSENEIDCNKYVKLSEHLQTLTLLDSGDNEGNNYYLCNFNGIEIVHCTYPFEIFFIKIKDRDNFEKLFENFNNETGRN